MSDEKIRWFPMFELQDWNYQSVVVVPDAAQRDTPPPSPVTARKWALGTFFCGQAFQKGNTYKLDGRLEFRPGIELSVSAHGTLGEGDTPASFEAFGIGVNGPVKGAVYQLVGWVFPDSVVDGAGRVVNIRGSVRAVRGPDNKPDVELGGMPLDTVGSFEIRRTT